jgi:hypothetical protein
MKYSTHKHVWQRGEIRKHGAIISVWICKLQEPELVRAFDMTVFNRNQFQGQSEYLMRRG